MQNNPERKCNTDSIPVIQKASLEDVWNLRHEVMWPDKPQSYVQLPEDENGIHLGVYLDNELISVISVFIKKDEVSFRKFCTKVSFQNRGFGSMLLKNLFEKMESLNYQQISCKARTNKVDYYRKFGMEVSGPSFVKDGQSYTPMKKIFKPCLSAADKE